MTQTKKIKSTIQGLRDFYNHSERLRHCKIIATLGPTSSDEKTITALVESGLDVARLNFSHGNYEQHRNNINLIRTISKKVGRNVAILQDLQGPKIRCGNLLNEQIKIQQGQTYRLAYGQEQKSEFVIPVDYKNLKKDIKVNDKVLMDDGLLIFKVTGINQETILIQCLEGGTLKSRKGINFPDSNLTLPALTEKDERDLLFGLSHNVDIVALSFVQLPQNILDCRKIITALGKDTPIIAKIEKLSAVDVIDEIANVADGLMVARGDLGIEGQVEKVPVFQRKIIAAGAKYGIPVIIATQMLESMTTTPHPTVSEVTDVANGVLEGADCVMLSGEVANGSFPVECVQKMVSIISKVENWSLNNIRRYSEAPSPSQQTWEDHTAIARATCEAADSVGARAIVCLTLTGSIASSISKWRPKTPIIAISPRHEVVQRLCFTWGVYGMKNPLFYNTDVLLQDLPQLLKSLGILSSGDFIVVTASIPIAAMKPTNMFKINRIP